MTIRYIKKEMLKENRWSGGTTTELLIGPKGSNYSERRFGYRVSTATVELESSTFTPLAGVTRFIMSLSGNLSLSHKGEYDIDLKPYEVDCFKGDWETTSVGKVVDFNLMLKDGYKGDLKVVNIENDELLSDHVNGSLLLLYSLEGCFTVKGPSMNQTVNPGDVLILENENISEIKVFGHNIPLVVAQVVI